MVVPISSSVALSIPNALELDSCISFRHFSLRLIECVSLCCAREQLDAFHRAWCSGQQVKFATKWFMKDSICQLASMARMKILII